jgi:carbonic anhydrase
VHVCETTIVQDAWTRGQPLTVHGWIYSLADGLIHELDTRMESAADVSAVHARAIATLSK